MSSNRLMYDSCAYEKSLQQSTSPLDYALYTGKYENTAKCRIEFGLVGGNGVSQYSGNLVDLESDLIEFKSIDETFTFYGHRVLKLKL